MTVSPRTVTLLSGGMDSSTLAYSLRELGHTQHGIGFDYGQRHVRELGAAENIANALGIPYKVISLAGVHDGILRHATSSQVNLGIDVPHGHYAADSMRATVVPNRNMIMLAIATAYAITLKADFVAYAAHAGDHTIYPDCRPAFASAMEVAMKLCDEHPVELLPEFVNVTKTQICKDGDVLGVPWDLTWSCYEGLDLHCGKCGTCIERREAFRDADVEDPTQYEPEA
jgi:7-cyano-7-deazaguanine synthase